MDYVFFVIALMGGMTARKKEDLPFFVVNLGSLALVLLMCFIHWFNMYGWSMLTGKEFYSALVTWVFATLAGLYAGEALDRILGYWWPAWKKGGDHVRTIE